MKPATGFLTTDNQFFQSEAEAARHEAFLLIQEWCESHRFKTTQVLTIVDALQDPIMEYIYAQKDIDAAAGQGAQSPPTDDAWIKQDTPKREQDDNPTGAADFPDSPQTDIDQTFYTNSKGTTSTLL